MWTSTLNRYITDIDAEASISLLTSISTSLSDCIAWRRRGGEGLSRPGRGIDIDIDMSMWISIWTSTPNLYIDATIDLDTVPYTWTGKMLVPPAPPKRKRKP